MREADAGQRVHRLTSSSKAPRVQGFRVGPCQRPAVMVLASSHVGGILTNALMNHLRHQAASDDPHARATAGSTRQISHESRSCELTSTPCMRLLRPAHGVGSPFRICTTEALPPQVSRSGLLVCLVKPKRFQGCEKTIHRGCPRSALKRGAKRHPREKRCRAGPGRLSQHGLHPPARTTRTYDVYFFSSPYRGVLVSAVSWLPYLSGFG